MPARADFRHASNFYLALGSECITPLLRQYARWQTGAAILPPQRWRKGLLLGASHLGDVLYRTASLTALKSGLPDCDWYYLLEDASAALVETHPAIAGTIIREPRLSGAAAPFDLALQLREQHFDGAICYDTGGSWRDLLLAVRAGIPNRVGYGHKGFSGLITHPIANRAPQPFPAYFRDLVAALTGQSPDWPLRPEVVATAADESAAASVWESLSLDSQVPVLACFVTTRQPHGQWSRASYAETLRLLSAQHGAQLLLCGAPGDLAVLEQIQNTCGSNCRVIAERLGLRALVAFLRRCTAVFCTDSGPRHLANAAGVPVFFMRNLWSSKIETGMYLDTELDLAPDAERITPGGEAEAFRDVTPGVVACRIARTLNLSAR